MGGRIALVTGGSRGIGAATAKALARDGHRVAVTYSSDVDGAHEVVTDLDAIGSGGLALRADVRDPESVDAAFAAVEEAWGPVEVLVANAGVTADGLIVRMGDAQWDNVLRTNLDGAFIAVRRAVAGMLRARWGRVVAVSSVAGSAGSAGQANYAAAKAGLVGMTKTVAAEVARRGVTVNAVAPGFITTEMTAGLGDDNELLSHVPARRAGTPEEVAACVRFLASEDAGYVTGSTLTVDGGLSA